MFNIRPWQEGHGGRRGRRGRREAWRYLVRRQEAGELQRGGHPAEVVVEEASTGEGGDDEVLHQEQGVQGEHRGVALQHLGEGEGAKGQELKQAPDKISVDAEAREYYQE